MWTAMRHAETRLGFIVKFSFCTAANCILLLVWAIVGANPLSAQAYVSVQVNNLTHPDLAPSFVAGDAYQYIVSGPPNQPVYNVQNSGPMTQVGQTDSNGTYVASGVEQAAWVGNYTQTWYVGNVAATPSLSFTVSVAAVVAHNLTHPDLAPNFLVGDTYQYNVYGPPNQPVYNVQNSGPLTQVGQTDNNGTYTTSGVEQTAWIGSYTQVWSVGNNQASPALSFLVGQINSGGTLTTTSVGQTSDGSVVGISSVSVANGVATTYSATEMQYNASLYYDAQTVGTLYEGGNQVQQGYDYRNGTAGGSLSYSATPWNDYSLQTDHYAVAYLVSGGYYENPLYYQDGSCGDGSSDCTYWPDSGGALYITAATIYLGSTLTDQTAVPQDGSLTFDDNIDGVGSILPGRTPPPGGWAYVVNKWKGVLAAAWTITLAKQQQDNTAVLPFMLQVIGDCQTLNQNKTPRGTAERLRSYRVLDGLGRPWSDYRRLVVREDMITWTAGADVGGGGSWGTSKTGAKDSIKDAIFIDQLRGGLPTDTTVGAALQQFYAQDFDFSGFSYPNIDGYSKPTVPLLVVDAMSKTSKGIFGTLGLTILSSLVTINNDKGNAPNLIYPHSGDHLVPPPITCGGP